MFGQVFVPRTRVFGLEDALASPWNVACFRYSISHSCSCSCSFSCSCTAPLPWTLHALNWTLNLFLLMWFLIEMLRIPAVVQTDTGILLAFAEVKIVSFLSFSLPPTTPGQSWLLCWLCCAGYSTQEVSHFKYEQTLRQKDKQTNRWTDKQTERRTSDQTDTQTDWQDLYTHWQADTQKDRKPNTLSEWSYKYQIISRGVTCHVLCI